MPDTLSFYEEQLLNTPDSELSDGGKIQKYKLMQRMREQGNTQLQSGAESDTILKDETGGKASDLGGNVDEGSNTELLERRRVSAFDRSKNRIRTYGANTKKISNFVGMVSNSRGTSNSKIRAGDSGWLAQKPQGKNEKSTDIARGLFGEISRIK